MKKITKFSKNNLFLLFFILSNSLFSQGNSPIYEDIVNKDKVITAQFDSIFPDEKAKNDFKKLRDFLSEKEILKNTLISISYNYYVPDNEIEINKRRITGLQRDIENKKDDQIVETDDSNFLYRSSYDSQLTQKVTVKEVKEKIQYLTEINADLEKKLITSNRLKKSIDNIKQDIRNCQNQIDTALDPENRKQDFKSTVSGYFVYLIGLILICFFSIIFIRSDKSLSKDLLGGYGLQFITLFVLIIAVILFGILDILKSSELAAMLSGISGYILGKGIQDKKLISDNTNANLNPNPNPNPDPNPDPDPNPNPNPNQDQDQDQDQDEQNQNP